MFDVNKKGFYIPKEYQCVWEFENLILFHPVSQCTFGLVTSSDENICAVRCTCLFLKLLLTFLTILRRPRLPACNSQQTHIIPCNLSRENLLTIFQLSVLSVWHLNMWGAGGHSNNVFKTGIAFVNTTRFSKIFKDNFQRFSFCHMTPLSATILSPGKNGIHFFSPEFKGKIQLEFLSNISHI